MKLICPKCLGMKKFMVGVPVARKCDKHKNQLIHVKSVIEMPADSESETNTDTQWPSKDELAHRAISEVKSLKEMVKTSLETAIDSISDLGITELRLLGKRFKVEKWWLISKKKLAAKIKKAIKAKHAK